MGTHPDNPPDHDKNGKNGEQTPEPTTTSVTKTTPTATIGARVRALAARVLPSQITVLAWGYYALFMILGFLAPVGVAAAQQGGGGGGVGSQLCGTPIAKAINKLAPLALGAVVIGGLILAYLLHAYAGFKKDPEQVRYVKEWRTRAAISAVSAPLLGYLLQMIIGFMGLGLTGCIHIVPGLGG